MKIRIHRANTIYADAMVVYCNPFFLNVLVDYIDELRQQAKWESEK